MNQFDLAKAKFDKNRQARPLPKVEAPEKKEEPKKVERKVQSMRLTIDGPVPLSFELHFAGTLLASQINEKDLRALFKKCLLPIGRLE